jgi:hypothetical protein
MQPEFGVLKRRYGEGANPPPQGALIFRWISQAIRSLGRLQTRFNFSRGGTVAALFLDAVTS